MFDFFKDLFSDLFGGDDNNDEDGEGWSSGDPDNISFAPDDSGFDLGSFVELQDRLLDESEIGNEDEYVNTFFSLDEAIAYVEGTPENILQIVISNSNAEGEDSEVYEVYRVAYE